MPIDFTNLDPKVVALAKAIRTTESNNNYDAVGDNGDSHGAYQFNKGNFAHWASQEGLDPNDFSPVNQDKVAYAKIKGWKDQGYHADEIAAMWNGSHLENGRPVANNPEYLTKVEKALSGGKSNGGLNNTPATTNAPGSGLDNYPVPKSDAPRTNLPPDNPSSAATGMINNNPSVFGLGTGLATAIRTGTGETGQTGTDESQMIQSNQKIIDAIHNSNDPVKKQRLMEFLKRQQTGNADANFHNGETSGNAPTQAEIDPGTTLTKKQVGTSALLTTLLALSGGSLPGGGVSEISGAPTVAESGVLSSSAEANNPLLLNLIKSGASKLTPTSGSTVAKGFKVARNVAAGAEFIRLLKKSPAKGLVQLAGHIIGD